MSTASTAASCACGTSSPGCARARSTLSSATALSRSAVAAAAPDAKRTSAEAVGRSEEHTSELQSQSNLVCRLLLEKKKKDPDVSAHFIFEQIGDMVKEPTEHRHDV